ncbi:MAG: chorismate synthase [Candidatus Margulisbacteria bacterium]|nr:chorismate synthase [Candidatus Margulisiibacteriota bacterium]MBU1617415.1 chorismate synthase [Candidatus Margulisiibacteriota bacterium]MBU1867767.1 chorismate synthase [Candidatus Margulisiibacteriota bacterium]
MRYLTAGESHGPALTVILDGCPANLPLSADDLAKDLARRQGGAGRGARMKIEQDIAELLSGVRQGLTIGSPISLLIKNKSTEFFGQPISRIRPGHADLAGAIKYSQKDIRNVLERASARETAGRVAAGAIAKKLLGEFAIEINSRVVQEGGVEGKAAIDSAIDKAREEGDTLGGIFEVVASGLPAGLGSYTQWDRRLDGKLAQAVMAIPAIKGVEIGLGFAAASLHGSKVHDEIFHDQDRGFYHKTNHAGGLEGGVTNGEAIVLKAAMKPISTLLNPLNSVDLTTKKPTKAHVERSDVSAVEAAGVVGEAVVALEIANAFLEKFGGDSLEEIRDNFSSYKKRLSML